MSELLQVQTALRRTARRRRWQNAWRGLWQGVFLGAVLWLAVFGLYKVLPLPFWALLASACAAAFCAVAGLVAGGWRPVTLLGTARWVDQQQQLKERLSTALELSDRPGDDEWKTLLLRDAVKHVNEIDPGKLLPLSLPRISRWALLALALSAGLGFVPEYRTAAYVQRQHDAANIRQTGKQLAELMRHNLEQKPPALEPAQKAIETVAELGDQFARASLTRSEALRDLASVAEKLSQQAKELGQNPALRPLERAAREPGGGSTSPEELAKNINDLQKALGKAAGKADQLDKLSRDLQKLRDRATKLPDRDSAEGDAARQAMAQSLGDLAQQARDLGASLPGLEEAIEALKSGQTDLFLRDLQAAMSNLEKMKELSKAMQQLQQQLSKIGRDLAEQLEKGQAQAAQSTLQKMIDQLRSGQCTSEQLQKLVQEVNKAVEPGSQYGKVGEHLKQAAANLQGSRNPDAAKNLDEAAKELERLMQQMADSQSLREAMEALQRAQSSIAMGKNWDELSGTCSACNGRGCSKCFGRGRRPGWGEGGGLGAGVGTWADEEGGWTYFPDSDVRYDNSGVQRPDQDPRGLTTRPDDLNPNLAPTKVKGNFQPGGSMPSVTLKGVSIKGTSTVQYEDAATAAQSDAQNALNQDKVPRAYQQAVKDYFDDLKK